MAHVDIVSQLKTLWALHKRRISVQRACYRFHLHKSAWIFQCPTFSNLSWNISPLSPCCTVRLSGRSLRFPNRSICSYCTTARHTIKGQTSSAREPFFQEHNHQKPNLRFIAATYETAAMSEHHCKIFLELPLEIRERFATTSSAKSVFHPPPSIPAEGFNPKTTSVFESGRVY
jgi:hypothetical protein